MKKIILVATTILILSACSKGNDDLGNTSWKWSVSQTGTWVETGEVSDVRSSSFEIKFDGPTHGHAYLHCSDTNYWNDTPRIKSLYGVFDVSYSFNNEEKEGTITFTKEHCEGENYADEFLAEFWNNPITSSFYIYANDGKMFLYTYPSDMAYYNGHQMVLTKE